MPFLSGIGEHEAIAVNAVCKVQREISIDYRGIAAFDKGDIPPHVSDINVIPTIELKNPVSANSHYHLANPFIFSHKSRTIPGRGRSEGALRIEVFPSPLEIVIVISDINLTLSFLLIIFPKRDKRA